MKNRLIQFLPVLLIAFVSFATLGIVQAQNRNPCAGTRSYEKTHRMGFADSLLRLRRPTGEGSSHGSPDLGYRGGDGRRPGRIHQGLPDGVRRTGVSVGM